MSRLVKRQKQAWQSLTKQPGFIATVVLTMGLSLGALLCVLTLAYQMLLAPLPYPEQDRLYQVTSTITAADERIVAKALTYPGAEELYKKRAEFGDAALLNYAQDVLTSHALQPTLNIGFVTDNWFSLLAIDMAQGRGLEVTEGMESFNPVAVISHKTWQETFAADPDVVGTTMSFSGTNFRIIGVISEHFSEPALNPDHSDTQVWLPWDYNLVSYLKGNWLRPEPGLLMLAKLGDEQNPLQVAQTSGTVLDNAWQTHTDSFEPLKGSYVENELTPLAKAISGDLGTTVMLLIIGVVGLVAIASVNIANLFMSRTAEQQRNLAIQATLGATPNRLFMHLLHQSGQLMMLSILLALPVAAIGFALLQGYLSDVFVRTDELALGPFTLFVAVSVVVLFALLFAALGSRLINYNALNTILQSSGKGTGIQVSKRTRTGLMFSQVAIATVLVFVNGVLFTGAVKLINQPLGFQTDNIMRLDLSFSGARWPSEAELIPTMVALQKNLEQLPEVARVSRASPPLRPFMLAEMVDAQGDERFLFESKSVSFDYFDLIAQPFLRGESFAESDQRDYSRVLIVNDVFANRISPDGDVIGKVLTEFGSDTYRIIGVVKGIKVPGHSEIPPRGYRPTSLALGSSMIEVKPGKTLTREQVIDVLGGVNKQFAVGRFDSLSALKDRLLFTQYMTAVTTAALAILSLFVTAVGLYGILSYATTLRRTEFGTRMAIGAHKGVLVKMVFSDNIKPVIAAIVLGLIALVGLYAVYQEAVSPYLNFAAIWVMVATLASIIGITFIAGYLPLKRFVDKPVIYSLR